MNSKIQTETPKNSQSSRDQERILRPLIKKNKQRVKNFYLRTHINYANEDQDSALLDSMSSNKVDEYEWDVVNNITE